MRGHRGEAPEAIDHEATLYLKQKLGLADCTYPPPGCDVSPEITKAAFTALRRRKMRVVPLQAAVHAVPGTSSSPADASAVFPLPEKPKLSG